jgi:hypothetical protein
VRNPDLVRWADMAVLTEVLEHLADPHGVVDMVADHCRLIVASSPWGERPGSSIPEHIWGWDEDGYRALIGRRFEIMAFHKVGWSQIVLGMRK